MINLIPNEEKKKKLKDFYFRLFVTSLFVFGAAIIVAAVGLLPAYFLSVVKGNVINSKLESGQKENAPEFDQKTVALVKDLNTKLGLVDKNKTDRYLVSEKVVNQIIKEKMPDIKIVEIIYQYDTIKGRAASVYGLAPSRDRLLLFKRALEDGGAFKKVDLPISNLVKGSNIRFTITLIPV